MGSVKNILVTGGGAPGAYGILNALKETGQYRLFSCDIQAEVVGEQLADDFFTLPAGDDPEYISQLLKICTEKEIELIFPITTRELVPLSQNIHLFQAEGIQVIVSESSSLEIANSKCLLYQHLREKNIAVPDFKVVKTFNEFQNSIAELESEHQRLVFKPCTANGSRGFRIIDPFVNEKELLLNMKPNACHITKDKAFGILGHGAFTPMLVSEFIGGEEYSVDCLVNRGAEPLIIPRLRSKINNGISVAGQVVDQPEVIQYCKQILSSLDLLGPIGIQVKMKDDQPLILEINPRIQGTSIALKGAGVNIPALAVSMALNEVDLDAFDRSDIAWGKKFVRHYDEIFLN